MMLIGGSTWLSSAGGMKTTTLAVLLANAAATFLQRESAQFFGRRESIAAPSKTAATILTMYLTLFFGGAVFISAYESLPFSACLYETASAVGTVGLTLGITPQLHIPSQMGTDCTHVSGQGRWSYPYLCSTIRQKRVLRSCR